MEMSYCNSRGTVLDIIFWTRVCRKQFLGTVFNQHIALMLVYSGGAEIYPAFSLLGTRELHKIMLLLQISYAIKNLLKVPKAP